MAYGKLDLKRLKPNDRIWALLIDTLWREKPGLFVEKFLSEPDPDEPKQNWLGGEISEDVDFGLFLGQDHQINGNRSIAIGQGLNTGSFMEILIGAYATIAENQTADEWVETDRLLALGNSPDDTERSNALEIFKSGLLKLMNAVKLGKYAHGAFAPEDGMLQYTPEAALELRHLNAWIQLLTDANVDGKAYGRKDGQWAEVIPNSTATMSAILPADSVIVREAASGAVKQVAVSVFDDYYNTKYARKAAPETISGLWNFATAPTILGNTVYHSGNANSAAYNWAANVLTAASLNVSGSGTFGAGVNIAKGQTYKVDGTQISSSNLSDANNLVYINGTQTILGSKTFNADTRIAINRALYFGSGNARIVVTGTTKMDIYNTDNELMISLPVGGGLQNVEISNGLNVLNGNITASGTINSTGYRKDGTTLLLDQFKTESAGASGTLMVGAGVSTQPVWHTLNTALGAGALATNRIVKFDGTKFVSLSDGTSGQVLQTNADGTYQWTSLSSGQVYKGTWDASTNTPTLTNGTGTSGWWYRCVVAGTVNFGAGNITFAAGDDVIYNGSAWQRVPSSGYMLQPATSSVLGGVKIGSGVNVLADGTISVSTAYRPATWVPSWADITGKPVYATVATSGSYTDLVNLPTLFSGSYTDLTNKPTIPAEQVNSDWNAVSGVAQILNKPTLFSGSYTDLTNKPTIPTNTNQLTNGAGFISAVNLSINISSNYLRLFSGVGGSYVDILSATQSTSGVMSAADKTKLDGIPANANYYDGFVFYRDWQDFSYVQNGGSINFSAGSGISLSKSGETLTITNSAQFPGLGTTGSLAAAGNHTHAGVYDNYGGWVLSANGTNSSFITASSGVDFIAGTNVTLSKSGNAITINSSGGGSMVYPSAGIPISTGAAWGASIANNSGNWNTAYSNMGKVSIDGESTAYKLGAGYFSQSGGVIVPNIMMSTTFDPSSSLPISVYGVNQALALKADASHTHNYAAINGNLANYFQVNYLDVTSSFSIKNEGGVFCVYAGGTLILSITASGVVKANEFQVN